MKQESQDKKEGQDGKILNKWHTDNVPPPFDQPYLSAHLHGVLLERLVGKKGTSKKERKGKERKMVIAQSED